MRVETTANLRRPYRLLNGAVAMDEKRSNETCSSTSRTNTIHSTSGVGSAKTYLNPSRPCMRAACTAPTPRSHESQNSSELSVTTKRTRVFSQTQNT